MPRRLPAVLVLVFLAVVGGSVLVGILGGAGALLGEGRPRVAVGSEYAASFDQPVQGPRADVRLPWGTLHVSVSAPDEDLPAPTGYQAEADRRSPRGGSFVGVGVDVTTRDVLDVDDLPSEDARWPSLAVRVGDRTYPLTELLPSGDDDTGVSAIERHEFVAVDGHPDADDVSLVVGYDGVDQTVSVADGEVDPGAAATLYTDPDTARVHRRACGPVRLDAGSSPARPGTPRCTTTWRRVPHVTGLGWAAPGRAWLVVAAEPDYRIDVVRQRAGRRTTLREDLGRDRGQVVLRFAGRAPVRRADDPPLQVFDVADGEGGTLTVIRRYPLRGEGYPPFGSVRAQWSVRLGPA